MGDLAEAGLDHGRMALVQEVDLDRVGVDPDHRVTVGSQAAETVPTFAEPVDADPDGVVPGSSWRTVQGPAVTAAAAPEQRDSGHPCAERGRVPAPEQSVSPYRHRQTSLSGKVNVTPRRRGRPAIRGRPERIRGRRRRRGPGRRPGGDRVAVEASRTTSWRARRPSRTLRR